MTTKVSMEDIARQVNVSRATVSYVLNGRSGETISETTRIRVLQAAQELGYRPNRAAQALRGQRSYQIEFCVYDVYPTYYSRIIQEFQHLLEPTRYNLQIVSTRMWTEADWEGSKGEWPMDGILTFDIAMSPRMVEALKRRQVPVVNTGVVCVPEIDHVVVDFRDATLEAVHHLIGMGRKRIARMTQVYGRGFEIFPGDVRYQIYEKALLEAGLEPEYIVMERSGLEIERHEVYAQTLEYVETNGYPDAIFCSNDDMSIAVMCALKDMGLRIPEDVALIGCDNIQETEFHRPTLSTMKFPYSEIARQGWDFLQRRIEDPLLPVQSAILKTEFIGRQSSS